MSAIKKTKGPCVILAGAGTGKTYTIVEKVKYLIENNIYIPEKIVCITFSNEAANGLQSRVRKFLSGEKEPVIMTFHAFAAEIIRKYGESIGIKKDFNILIPDEAKVMLHRALRVLPNYCHKYVSTMSSAKDLGISLSDLKTYLQKELNGQDVSVISSRCENLQFELQTFYLKENKEKKSKISKEIKYLKSLIDIKRFITAWESYEKIKIKQNYLDYSDLHINALKLLEKFPEISESFSYIIVDEFQDTNKVQLDFLKALAPHRNITVVGDLNQSIYRFRGAYKDNLQVFRKYFEVQEEDIYTLKDSFRSPNKVLRNAHTLILNNYTNKEECFYVENAHKREGEKIEVYELRNAKEEARKVAEIVQREIKEGKNYEDICVMFRTHQHGIIIKKTLEKENIPYSAVNKGNLLKNPAVKTVIDYLSIANIISKKSKGGEQSWWDLIYQLDFLEEDLIQIGRVIKEKKDEDNISLKLLECLDKLPLSTSGRLSSKILVEKINIMLSFIDQPINETLKKIYALTGFFREGESKEEKNTVLNLNKLLDLSESHSALYGPEASSFLQYLEILSSLGIDIESSSFEEKGVRLMTLHATKGLEYKTVIVTNMAQKRFPLEKISSNTLLPSEILPELKHLQKFEHDERENQIEEYERHNLLLEERRLCYVAFTRAREKLVITYAEEYADKKFYPSVFLNEIKYKNNQDIAFEKDESNHAEEQIIEIKSSARLGSFLNSSNFEEVLISVIKNSERKNTKISSENKVFSPSALLSFTECEKAYEYKYIYNMPDRKTTSWESMLLGSFLHTVLEEGVNMNFKTLKDFTDKAKEIHMSEEWASVDLDEALRLIAVFYARNKDKYDEKSKTEQELKTNIGEFQFLGFADRIDYKNDGLEIIDYKTGKHAIAPKHRNWQLGFYALAARQYGKVKTITLDMLKQEKPLEFKLDEEGNAVGVHSDMSFNIYEVEKELIDTAKAIISAYENGFKPCPPEKNCEFCNEYVYGI